MIKFCHCGAVPKMSNAGALDLAHRRTMEEISGFVTARKGPTFTVSFLPVQFDWQLGRC